MIIPCLVIPRSLLTLPSNRLTLAVVNMMIYRKDNGVGEVQEVSGRQQARLTRVNVGKLGLVVRLVIQTPGGLGSS